MSAITSAPASAATATSNDTSFCPEVFSGDFGALGREDYPARYQEPVQDNGDGTFTLSYGLILSRHIGSMTADVAYDCTFVDANRSGSHDPGESLYGVVVQPAPFGVATSSTLRLVIEVTVHAEPGDQVCGRGQVESSYEGNHVDKSPYYCETIPGGEVNLPAGVLGGLPFAAVLAVGLLATQRRPRLAMRRATVQRPAR